MKRLLVITTLLYACNSGNSTAASENPLGVLVECDEVIEEVVGYNADGELVERRKVAYVPVDDPLSARIVRCGYYYGSDDEVEADDPLSGAKCEAMGSVTFTPARDAVVECEVETDYPGEGTQRYGYERVYLRINQPEDTAPSSDSAFGVSVECDQWIEETSEVKTTQGGVYHRVNRRKVAYVPVEDPASLTITRCGEHRIYNGETYWSRTDCVANTQVTFTADSHAIVECEEEETTLETGDVYVYGYQQLYIHEDPDTRDRLTGLGVPVECDELLEWEFSPGTVHATEHRLSVAYLPVADPTSVTITRCGRYEISHIESTYSDACVSSKGVSFTEDFEVYVRCEEEGTGWLTSTRGYKRTYFRED